MLNEERHIEACLGAISRQTYDGIVEVLVVDGGSSDRTRELAARYDKVRVLHNPGRIQARGLNLALQKAVGEVFVRVDGHTIIEPDYVSAAVRALASTGAAMVGGAIRPVLTGEGMARGIALAMSSPFGPGPAKFHRGGSSWVDTVYLGACRTEVARVIGGYDDRMAANEDAEFAIRIKSQGGVWLDDDLRSAYTPRTSHAQLWRQFLRYGRYRAVTLRRHPRSLSSRQLAPPLLVLALLSPARRPVAVIYVGGVVALAAKSSGGDPAAVIGFGFALPVMHVAWGLGLLIGLVAGPPRKHHFE